MTEPTERPMKVTVTVPEPVLQTNIFPAKSLLGSEDSSGMVLILLIFPTIFFCLLPFSIYDLIPFIFNDSTAIWEYFQEPPGKPWYLSVLLGSVSSHRHPRF